MRSDHPLRRVAALIDFKFVREEVVHCYGNKGNISVDPEVIKLHNNRVNFTPSSPACSLNLS